MTICIGRPIIEILAKEGAWSSSEGNGSVVAASDLFKNNPYEEIERLRAAMLEAKVWFLRPENVDLNGSDRVYRLIDDALANG